MTIMKGAGRMSLLAGLAVATTFLISHPVPAQESPGLRICTAGETGNYYFFGRSLAAQLRDGSQAIVTKGSYDNIGKMISGDCDAAVIQSDAWYVYKKENPTAGLDFERVGPIFKEYAHLFCNAKQDVGDQDDLTDKIKVAVGDANGGSWVTWKGMVAAEDDFAVASIDTVGGSRAVNRVVDGSDTNCMLYVSSLNTPFMQNVAALSQNRKVLRLAELDDSDLNDAVDDKGASIYDFAKIPKTAYPGLTDDGAYDTITVDALFVVSNSWIDKNERAFDKISDLFPSVVRQVKKEKGIVD